MTWDYIFVSISVIALAAGHFHLLKLSKRNWTAARLHDENFAVLKTWLENLERKIQKLDHENAALREEVKRIREELARAKKGEEGTA